MTAQTEQFSRELNLSSSALKYLEERFLTPEDVKNFNIGFCPSTSSYPFDFLNGRLIVPIFDAYGNEVAYAGRKLEAYGAQVKDFYQEKINSLDGLNRYMKWRQSKWINSPYKKSEHLFNLNKAKHKAYSLNFCFIVEGYFDAIHLAKMGHENVVAICGTSLTDRHCELLFRYCNNIVLMLDGDVAGQKATIKSVHKARQNMLFSHVVKMPDGLDPDQLTKEQLELIKKDVINSDEELYITL
jgi:DNA primase